VVESDGSFMTTMRLFGEQGINGLYFIWPSPSWAAGKLILAFAFFEAFLQVCLPGEEYHGPLSPTGHRPVYKVRPSWLLTTRWSSIVTKLFEILLTSR
jgi:7-dehydrocholesterol reductase